MAVDVGERTHDDINHDHLTGLLNLRGLELEFDRLSESIPGQFAICYVDLDGLKAVNDNEGHDAGNEYLKKAGETLSQSVRTKEDEGRPLDVVSVARIGGDEFVVLLHGVSQRAQLDAVLPRIRENMEVAGTPASLDAVIHEPGIGRDNLLGIADAGMAADKAARKKALFEALPKRKRVAAKLGTWLVRYAGVNPPRQ